MAPAMDVAWERWVARRDPQALNQIVHDSAGMVYATCLRILGNPTEAEDVAQECFEALLREKDAARVRVVGAWLHGAATYRSLTHLRAEDRRVRREAQYAAEQPVSAEPARSELNQCVDEALAELPEDARVALVQTFLCGRTQREVAKQLGTPRRTLRHRIDTGLEQLGQFLRQRGVAVEVTALAAVLAAATAQASQAPASLTATLGKLVLSQSAGAAAPMVVTAGVGAKGVWMVVGLLTALSALGTSAWLLSGKTSAIPQDAAIAAVVPETAAPAAPVEKSAPQGNIMQGLMAWLRPAPTKAETTPTVSVKVSGIAVDEDGAPATDVRVGLAWNNTYGMGTKASVPVNDKGEFVCTESSQGRLEAGKYGFFYCSKTFGTMDIYPVEAPVLTITSKMIEENREVGGMRIVVPSAKRAIRGTVRDERGQPVAGAMLIMHNGTTNAETLSGGDGGFALTRIRPNMSPMSVDLLKSMKESYYPISISHPEFESVNTDAKLGDDNVKVTLHPRGRGSVKGMVIDARTGKPLLTPKVWIGRMVTAYGETMVLNNEEGAKVQAGGSFVLKDLPPGSPTVWASAPGYGTGFASAVKIEPNAETADVVIRLEPEGIIEVRGNLEAHPDSAHVVYVSAIKEGASREDYHCTYRPKDGVYRLSVAPGQYEVVMDVDTAWDTENIRVGHICYSTSVEVEEGKTTSVELGTPGNGMVQGVFSPPLADGQTMVFALRKGAHSDSVSDDWAETRPYRKGGWMMRMAVENIFVWGGHHRRDESNDYSIGFLPAGTFTVTALLYDDATKQIHQQSKVFTVGDAETATVDFEF